MSASTTPNFLPADAKYPYPIGIEAAGVVEDVGSSVSRFRAGDRVAFVSSMQAKGGTWAEFAAIPADGTIFVAGGSGAIGSLAIQIACQRGWQVIASASPANHDYLRSLGAFYAADYHDPGWTDQVREKVPGGVDAAIAVHPGTSQETLAVVKDGGALVTISGDSVETERGIQVETVPYGSDVRAELVITI